MLVAPLVSLTGVSVTGLLLDGVEENAGPVAETVSVPPEAGCDAAVSVPTAYADEDERHEATAERCRR